MSNAIANTVEKVAAGKISIDEVDETLLISIVSAVAKSNKGGFTLEPLVLLNRARADIKSRAGNLARLPDEVDKQLQEVCREFARIRTRALERQGFFSVSESAIKPVFRVKEGDVREQSTIKYQKELPLDVQLAYCDKEKATVLGKIAELEAVKAAQNGNLDADNTMRLTRLGNKLERVMDVRGKVVANIIEAEKAKKAAQEGESLLKDEEPK